MLFIAGGRIRSGFSGSIHRNARFAAIRAPSIEASLPYPRRRTGAFECFTAIGTIRTQFENGNALGGDYVLETPGAFIRVPNPPELGADVHFQRSLDVVPKGDFIRWPHFVTVVT